jgi:hypothetical protein
MGEMARRREQGEGSKPAVALSQRHRLKGKVEVEAAGRGIELRRT